MPHKSANSWLSFLVKRPGHQYWNARTLDAKNFVDSYVSKYFPKQSMVPFTIPDADGVIGAAVWLAEYASCANSTQRTLTTDTAANYISNLGLTKDSDSFDTVISNLSAANTLILQAGTGVNFYGERGLVQSQSIRLRMRRLSATTVDIYVL